MGALSNISCPASLSYAGYAWEFLRRNPEYRIAYERSRASSHKPHTINSGGSFIRLKTSSKAAEKWGLQSFADPDLNYLRPISFGRTLVLNKLFLLSLNKINPRIFQKNQFDFQIYLALVITWLLKMDGVKPCWNLPFSGCNYMGNRHPQQKRTAVLLFV